MGRRSWVRAVPVVVVLVVAACSGGSDGAASRTSASDPATTGPTSSRSSTPSTTKPAAPKYLKAKPDPSLPRQDIDVKVSYPSSFTKAQVAVVQAWTNYRHVFFTTLDPPTPNSSLFKQVTDAEGVQLSKDQRRKLLREGLVARLPKDGSSHETVTEVQQHNGGAVLITCQVDSSEQIATKTHVIVNGTVTTKRLRVVFVGSPHGSLLVSGDSTQERKWAGDRGTECVGL